MQEYQRSLYKFVFVFFFVCFCGCFLTDNLTFGESLKPKSDLCSPVFMLKKEKGKKKKSLCDIYSKSNLAAGIWGGTSSPDGVWCHSSNEGGAVRRWRLMKMSRCHPQIWHLFHQFHRVPVSPAESHFTKQSRSYTNTQLH